MCGGGIGMKLKNIIIMICCCFLLLGCQGKKQDESQPTKKMYEGLDAKTTYTEAVNYFNEHVQYYKSEICEEEITVKEKYKVDDQYSVVTKALYQDGDFPYLDYTITSGSHFHSLFFENGNYKYKLIDDYNNTISLMYPNIMGDKDIQMIDIERHDENDKIILNLKFIEAKKYQNADKTKFKNYITNEMIINKEGFIEKEYMEFYKDDSFTEKLDEYREIVNSQFNQKDKKDLDKEINLMKSCDGLDIDQIQEKIGL